MIRAMNTMLQSPRLNSLRKNHSRWAWMAGATAAAAASPGAHAATAQITLVNDTYNQAGLYQLSLMVTSGHPFGSVTQLSGGISGPIVEGFLGNFHRHFAIEASQSATNFAHITARSDGINVSHAGAAKPQKAFALIPLQITDPNVAGGQANTNALLEAEAFNNGVTDEFVALLAVFYSTPGNTTPPLTIDSNTGAITGPFTNVGSSDNGVFTPAGAPEPSGLALLALGAGGILARRQRRKAA
jgi:hypothetical protein